MKLDLVEYFLRHGHAIGLSAQRGNSYAQQVVACRELYDKAQDRGSRLLLKQAIAEYESYLQERSK